MWRCVAVLCAGVMLGACSNTVQAVKTDTRNNLENVARTTKKTTQKVGGAIERGVENTTNALVRTEEKLE